MSLAFAKGLTPRPGRAGAAAAAAPAGASRQRGLLGFSVLLSGLLGFMSPAPLLGWLEVSVLEPALVSAAGAFGLAGLLARLASLAEEGRERSMVAGPRPIGWLFLPLIIFPLQSHMHSSSDLPRSWLRAAAGRSFAFLSIAVALPVSLVCAVDLVASVHGHVAVGGECVRLDTGRRSTRPAERAKTGTPARPPVSFAAAVLRLRISRAGI